MKKVEAVLILVSLISFLSEYLFFDQRFLVSILCLLLTTCFYFYFSFALFNEIKVLSIFKKSSYDNCSTSRIFGSVFLGFSISILILGVVFRLLSWPGADFNLIFGIISLMMITVVGIFKYKKSQSYFYINIIKRTVFYMAIGIITFF